MYAIATLANNNALDDLKVFLFSLQLYNENNLPDVYIYCDTQINTFLETQTLYKGIIHKKVVLDMYNGFTRAQMEKMSGKNYENKWVDLMCEKMNLLEWVYTVEKRVLFCDADICFLGGLPNIDDSVEVGLSRHFIRNRDEVKFGIYNGGFVFSSSNTMIDLWKTATKSSRYFEQAALEELCTKYTIYEFPIQNNYGWWRLLQGNESIEILKGQWSIKRNNTSSGICVQGMPLLSIHTHWKTNDISIKYFNDYVLTYLEKLKSVDKTKKLIHFIKKL